MSDGIMPLTDGYLDAAARVFSDSWRASHDFCAPAFVVAHTPQHQRARILAQREEGKRFFLLLRDGACLGLVSVHDDLIENLYIDPAHWHQGIGRQLLAYAESLCTRPRLFVLSNNGRAIHIYTRAGYRFSGRENRLSETLTEREMLKSI